MTAVALPVTSPAAIGPGDLPAYATHGYGVWAIGLGVGRPLLRIRPKAHNNKLDQRQGGYRE
jgi:hypothetical protein